MKKDRLDSVPEKCEKQKKSKKTTEPSEKLHEQDKQLQYGIVKLKQAEAHLDQRVANLTADNEQLRRELAKKKQTERDVKEPAEKKPPEKKPAGSGSKYEDFHRVVHDVERGYAENATSGSRKVSSIKNTPRVKIAWRARAKYAKPRQCGCTVKGGGKRKITTNDISGFTGVRETA